MNNLLLHVCCAPCAIYPVKYLSKLAKKKYQVTVLFYNPNIQPLSEYQQRYQSFRDFIARYEIPALESPGYYDQVREYFSITKKKVLDTQRRCVNCYALRLEKTAYLAADKKFDAFSSTMLISPHQDIVQIRQLGEKFARDYGINFFTGPSSKGKYKGFRSGFKKGRQEAKDLDLHCQDYCGCVYSNIERFKL